MDSLPHNCSFDLYGGCGHALANCHWLGSGRGKPDDQHDVHRSLSKKARDKRHLQLYEEGLCPLCVEQKRLRAERRLPAGTVG